MPRSLTTHIDSPREVGVRLKDARERAGLSQRQLAFPGCTAAYISRIEAGARVPSLQMIQQLALRVDVSGQWLATGVEPATADPAELIEAEVALRLGEVEEAERLYRAHLQPGDPARGAALAGLGQIAFRAERIEQAIELFEQAIEARKGSTLADPGAVDSLGRAYAISGAMESSIALFERALSEATAAEALVEQLRFAVLLANALIDVGAFGKAERALAEVIAIALRSDDDPVTSARIFWSQSRLHSMRGERQLAGRYARRALEILERTENDSYVALAYNLLAYTEIESGNYAEALELIARGRALLGDSGKRAAARFAIEEARALIGLDRYADAARAASKALELLETMQPADRGRAFVTLADVFLASGDAVRGRMLLEQGFDNLIEHGNRFALEAGRRLADLLESEGDTAGALEVLKRATEAAAAPARGAPLTA
ncbi:MAG TPA: helix-turn-helix domain-containing protein [Gaiellaceae bacterium]|nr:helix-turn-helix domain-containing protein [Gaiellaceae bacterium]